MNQHRRLASRPVVFSVFVLLPFVTSQVTAQQPKRDESAHQEVTPKVKFDSGDSALKIPLDIDNNIIRMLVKVNNSKPLKFIFDTGASGSAISSRRAAELGLKMAAQRQRVSSTNDQERTYRNTVINFTLDYELGNH